jgi:hypothetical protein
VFHYLELNPVPSKREEMLDLLQQAGVVLGIEVTVPELAEHCSVNIDPQHSRTTEGDVAPAAVEVALSYPLPTLATVRADADSVAFMALMELRARGITITQEIRERVLYIASEDKFARGPWPGPRPLDSFGDVQWAFKGLSVLASNFRTPLAERVALFEQWLQGGDCEGLEGAVVTARQAVEKAAREGQISVHAKGKLVVVTSPEIAATEVAYRIAPVAILRNERFRFQGGPEHLKYTVCAYKPELVDFPALLAALQAKEPGWGGNVTSGILGSPQGVASRLATPEVVALVTAHLRV